MFYKGADHLIFRGVRGTGGGGGYPFIGKTSDPENQENLKKYSGAKNVREFLALPEEKIPLPGQKEIPPPPPPKEYQMDLPWTNACSLLPLNTSILLDWSNSYDAYCSPISSFNNGNINT